MAEKEGFEPAILKEPPKPCVFLVVGLGCNVCFTMGALTKNQPIKTGMTDRIKLCLDKPPFTSQYKSP
jgi:hypothetical protein